jgi:hypothetical protein
VFEVVSGRDGLPVVLKLTMGSRLRQSLESNNMIIAGKRPDLGLSKIELDGKEVIDCTARAQVFFMTCCRRTYTTGSLFRRPSLF